MKTFYIDVKIAGDLYIQAEDEEAAKALLQDLFVQAHFLELSEDVGAPKNDPSSIYISGLPFDHPELPVVSLSPACTIYGPWDEAQVLELAE